MTSTFRWYLVGLLALFGAYVALEYYRPKPLDWRPTFINKDKIPYGTYVLYDQLPRLLGTDSVEATRLPIFNQLTGLPLALTDAANEQRQGQAGDSAGSGETAAHPAPTAADTVPPDTANAPTSQSADSTARGEEDEAESENPSFRHQANYLFVNTEFEASPTDARALLRFVGNGGDLFVAAEAFGDSTSMLLDTLGVRTRALNLPTHRGPRGLPVPDSVTVRFTAVPGARYRLPGADANIRLAVDSGRAGRTMAADAQGRAVLVRLNVGRGHVFLCSVPIAFTNQFVLRPQTSQFAATALSYLPARRTWWDEYQKQGRAGNQSLLRIVTGHEALNTAFYLLLVGGALFVLVAARRRQRIIPTIKPLPNTTLQFTRTVAGLYHQGSSHGLIAEKKVGLFMDYLRTRFQENAPDFGDVAFRERLSQKSGLVRARVDELLRLVNFARTAPKMTDKQLLQLSRALSDFRREAGR